MKVATGESIAIDRVRLIVETTNAIKSTVVALVGKDQESTVSVNFVSLLVARTKCIHFSFGKA